MGSHKKKGYTSYESEVVSDMYYERGTAPINGDWPLASLIVDGNWHTLDASALVPVGAYAINLHGRAAQNPVGNAAALFIRKDSNSGNYGTCFIRPQIDDKASGMMRIVGLTASKTFDYKFHTNGTWSDCKLTVRGWFAP